MLRDELPYVLKTWWPATNTPKCWSTSIAKIKIMFLLLTYSNRQHINQEDAPNINSVKVDNANHINLNDNFTKGKLNRMKFLSGLAIAMNASNLTLSAKGINGCSTATMATTWLSR